MIKNTSNEKKVSNVALKVVFVLKKKVKFVFDTFDQSSGLTEINKKDLIRLVEETIIEKWTNMW